MVKKKSGATVERDVRCVYTCHCCGKMLLGDVAIWWKMRPYHKGDCDPLYGNKVIREKVEK
jgi:hypothetical protein